MRVLIVVTIVAALGVGGIAAWAYRFPEIAAVPTPAADSFDAVVVERGEVLAAVSACKVCHTRPGGEDFAGGLALETPFGTIYSTNITPHPVAGIGAWSGEAFRRAMHQGIDREGRYLFPAFPYDHFTKATDEDVDAIYAFLMTREPADYRAPAPELDFPYNQRVLMAGWKLLFLDEGRYQADPGKSEEWNRGAYLVEGLGHCGACHTPRNSWGAEESGRGFDGATVEGWDAPALNENSPSPLPWTADALVNYLLDGWDGDHGIAEGPMTPVVNEFGLVGEDNSYAIAEYILSLQPQAEDEERAAAAVAFAEARAFGGSETASGGPAIDAAADPRLARGAEIFAGKCANCHRAGTETVPLALTSSVNGPSPANVIYAIEDGVQPPVNALTRSMPALGGSLTDEALGDLVIFVRSHFSQQPAWEGVDKHVRRIRAEQKRSASGRPMASLFGDLHGKSPAAATTATTAAAGAAAP